MPFQLLAHRPPRIAWSLTLAALIIHLLAPTQMHGPLPVAGAICATAGFAIMLRAWWLFRLAGNGICPTDPTAVLIDRDVYMLSRHPMYLGMLLMLAGLAAGTGALEFYLGAALLWVILDFVFCRFEEDKLETAFGQRYLGYRRRVRRWL